MSTCDPFTLIDDFLKKLKKIQQAGLHALDAATASRVDFPSSLQDMLECLVTGTADRSAAATYPAGYDPYDLEAFKQHVQIIYQSVVISAQESRDRITGNLLHSSDTSLATSGIWLSGQVADTFYGLVTARSRQATQDSADLAPLLDHVATLADDLNLAVQQIPQGDKIDVSRDAQALSEQTCPQLIDIADLFRQIAADVAASKSLGDSYCGATSLQDKIHALISSLPSGSAQPVARSLEIHRQLLDAVAAADQALARVTAGRDIIPAFDAQIEQASYVPLSEKEIHSAVAAQFEALCGEIQALRDARRFGEMQAVIPRISVAGAVALDILGNGPGDRVNTVRTHAAAPSYQGYVNRLNLISHVEQLTDRMDSLQADLSLAVYGSNNAVKERISELKDSLGAVETFRQDVQSAAAEYQQDVGGLVNELCVGVLTRLLAMTGYKEIEEKFLNGLFGEIPDLAKHSATTIGQLVQCLQEFTAGACRTLPASGAQRFALERLSDVTSAAERVQDFVSEAGTKIQGLRDSMTGSLDKLVSSIQKDVQSAIGAAPKDVPADSAAAPPKAPTGPRKGKPSGFECAQDVSTTADGFMKATNPVGLPPGVTKDQNGYLKHDGVSPLPAGTYRDENGFLKKLPDVAVPSRQPSVAPAIPSSSPGSPVFAPEILPIA